MPVELGSLPLPLPLVTQGLTQHVLALLRHAPVSVSFTASRKQGEAVQEELLIAAGDEAAEGRARQESSIFGFHLEVGQPLQIQMQVRRFEAAVLDGACRAREYWPQGGMESTGTFYIDYSLQSWTVCSPVTVTI